MICGLGQVLAYFALFFAFSLCAAIELKLTGTDRCRELGEILLFLGCEDIYTICLKGSTGTTMGHAQKRCMPTYQ